MPHDYAFFRFLARSLIAGTVAGALWLLPVPVFAAPNTGAINQAIEQQRHALTQTQLAQKSLRQQLAATQRALAESEAKRDDLADQRDHLQAEQAALQTQAETLDARIQTQKTRIDEGLRLAYTLGNQGPLGALIDPSHALDDARYLHYIREILAQTADQIQALRADQQAATANQQALTAAAQQLTTAQTQLDAALARHRQAQGEQNRLLAQLSAEADTQSQALAALLAKKKLLDDEISRLNAEAAAKKAQAAAEAQADTQANTQAAAKKEPSEAERKPKAATPPSELTAEETEVQAPRAAAAAPAATDSAPGGIPISGKIVRAYGAEIADGDMRAQGISFAAPAGSPVRAIAAGRVIFADSMKGWGELVIIKHPGGYLSLYANNHSLSVRTGQSVSAGTVIARSGQLSGHESGLYFEVRRGNDTVNPARWAAYRQARR